MERRQRAALGLGWPAAPPLRAFEQDLVGADPRAAARMMALRRAGAGPRGGRGRAACRAQPVGGAAWAQAFNFGPAATAGRTAADLVQELLKHWPGGWEDRSDSGGSVPAPARLQLSIDKAQNDLRWSPVWDFAAAARYTMAWYRDARMYKQSANFKRLTQDQIRQYSEAARSAGAVWTKS